MLLPPPALLLLMSTLGQMLCEELCHVLVSILLMRELRP